MRLFESAIYGDPQGPNPVVGSNEFIQDDGARWNGFYDERSPDAHYMIVTSVGRELLNGFGGIEKGEFFDMFDEYQATQPDTNGTMHDYLGKGQQATVYGMGDLIAAREQPGILPYYASISQLSVMDRLSSVVEGGIPRWISVPHYYACYSSPEAGQQFTFMERVDSGLTVEDMLNYPSSTHAFGNMRVEKEFDEESFDEHQDRVAELYVTAEQILRSVIAAKGEDPDQLLLDWKPRNVLVNRLRTPIGGEHLKLSIIDQN